MALGAGQETPPLLWTVTVQLLMSQTFNAPSNGAISVPMIRDEGFTVCDPTFFSRTVMNGLWELSSFVFGASQSPRPTSTARIRRLGPERMKTKRPYSRTNNFGPLQTWTLSSASPTVVICTSLPVAALCLLRQMRRNLPIASAASSRCRCRVRSAALP